MATFPIGSCASKSFTVITVSLHQFLSSQSPLLFWLCSTPIYVLNIIFSFVAHNNSVTSLHSCGEQVSYCSFHLMTLFLEVLHS